MHFIAALLLLFVFNASASAASMTSILTRSRMSLQ